jgi:hypothetical protein
LIEIKNNGEATSEAKLIGDTDALFSAEYENAKEANVGGGKKLSKWFFNASVCTQVELRQDGSGSGSVKHGFGSKKECESSCILANQIS